MLRTHQPGAASSNLSSSALLLVALPCRNRQRAIICMRPSGGYRSAPARGCASATLSTVFVTDRIWIHPAYRDALREMRLDTVAGVLDRTAGRVVAWSRTTDALHVSGDNGAHGVFVKRYLTPKWSKRFGHLVRGAALGRHRARSEHIALDALQQAGVNVVRPIAFGSRRVAGLLAASFILTEATPRALNLTTFAQCVESKVVNLPPPARHAAICELAGLVRHMHDVGCEHGNLFWRNILIRQRPDGSHEFFLLDPEPRGRWGAIAPREARLRELAQLAASAEPFTTRTDRLRFMRAYTGAGRAAENAALVESIWRLAQTHRAHEQRRIRFNRLFDTWSRRLTEESASVAAGGEGTASA